MRSSTLLCVTAVMLALGGSSARADQVHLVGGTMIEGKVVQKSDGKVILAVEAGEITLPADSIERIDSSASVVDQYDARYAKLAAGDLKARFALADFCRDHDMRAREKALLFEIVRFDPDNEEARTRLGFVKTDTGWIERGEAMRAQGMVLFEGAWLPQGEVAKIERLRAQAETARQESLKATLDVELRKAELESKQQTAGVAQPPPSAAAAPAPQPTYFYLSGSSTSSELQRDPDCDRRRRNCPKRGFKGKPFMIVGVRDPRDTSYFVPGVRDPLKDR